MGELHTDAAARLALVMGSTGACGVMKECEAILNRFHLPHALKGTSAHRTPGRAREFAFGAESHSIWITIVAG